MRKKKYYADIVSITLDRPKLNKLSFNLDTQKKRKKTQQHHQRLTMWILCCASEQMFVCILSVLIKVEVSISTLLYVFPLYYLIIFIATSKKVLTSNGSIQNYWSREPSAKNINVGKYRTNIFNEKCRERDEKKNDGQCRSWWWWWRWRS